MPTTLVREFFDDTCGVCPPSARKPRRVYGNQCVPLDAIEYEDATSRRPEMATKSTNVTMAVDRWAWRCANCGGLNAVPLTCVQRVSDGQLSSSKHFSTASVGILPPQRQYTQHNDDESISCTVS